jgi:hypothetical protein
VQTAATCGLFALNHALASLPKLFTRQELESHAEEDFTKGGDYEFQTFQKALSKCGCGMHPVTPAECEMATTVDAANVFTALFADGLVEDQRMLSYLMHTPNHWVAIVPVKETTGQALLCDSLFQAPFLLHGSDVAEMLEAIAINACESNEH